MGNNGPLFKETGTIAERQRRIEALSAEFPPPCVFDAEGAAEVLGLQRETARQFLLRLAKNGKLVRRREGRETVYRFPR